MPLPPRYWVRYPSTEVRRPFAFFRHGHDRGALAHNAGTHHMVVPGQADGAHADGGAAHHTGILLGEADGNAAAGSYDQISFTVGDSRQARLSPSLSVMAIRPDLRMLL